MDGIILGCLLIALFMLGVCIGLFIAMRAMPRLPW